MHSRTEKRLREKKWDDNAIVYALTIMGEHSNQRRPTQKVIDKFIDYVIIFSGTALSVGLAFLFFPVLLATKTGTFIFIMMPLAIIIGFLYGRLVRDLIIFEKERHELFAFMAPLLGTIAMGFVILQSNNVSHFLFEDYISHPVIIISLLYTISFLIPLIILILLKQD